MWNCVFLAFFNVFYPINLILFEKKSLVHLNVLFLIFFVTGVYKNIYVHYWTLLKAEKVRSWNSFWRDFFGFFSVLLPIRKLICIFGEPIIFLSTLDTSKRMIRYTYNSIFLPYSWRKYYWCTQKAKLFLYIRKL